MQLVRLTAQVLIALAFAPAISKSLPSGPPAMLDTYLRRCEASGLSGVVLVAKGDEVVFRGAYGLADKFKDQPMRVDSAFDVGSLSKQYTATAILCLVDQHAVRLDDRISRFFPDVPADKAGITVRELLNQQSGLDDVYWDRHPDMTETQYTAMLLGRPLIFTPGTEFRYSNFNYHLLKQIVEKVTHERFETFLSRELFSPVGCRFTGFKLPHWHSGQVVRYQDWSNRSPRFDATNVLDRPIDLQPEGSGGILATADDLFRWLVAVRTGKVLSQESTKTLFQPTLGGYACGWYVEQTARGTKKVYHGGFDTASGVVSGCYWYPDDDLTIILLANTNQNQSLHHDFFVPELENLMLGGPVDFPPQPVQVPIQELSECVGDYVLANGSEVLVSLQGGRLSLLTADTQTMLALRFVDPEQADTRSETARMIGSVVKGDYVPLQSALDPRINFDTYKKSIVPYIHFLKQTLGDFESAGQVGQQAYEFEGDGETDIFVTLKFQKGYVVLRAIRNAQGRIVQISPRNLTAKIELTLCPLGAGKFRTWDFATKSGSTFSLTHKTLKIATIVATRHEKACFRSRYIGGFNPQ